MSESYLRPELFIAVVKNESGYLAIGSRKINYLDLEHKIEYGEMWGNYDFNMKGVDRVSSTEIKGEVNGFTMVQGVTRLAAIGQLIDCLDKEQAEEDELARKLADHRADYRRFGGEVNEDLIRKVVKWRKKQAAKQSYIDDYEGYDEQED